MTRALWRRMVTLVTGVALLGSALTWLRPVESAGAQGDQGTWVEPVNLSASGSASQPVIAAGTGDTLHALWWDPFEGTKYASYAPQSGWSAPTTVGSIIGGRDRDGTLLAPRNMVVLGDAARFTHVFWLDIAGNLMYARKQVGFSDWSGATQLATAPLAWEASVDAANRLHVAFIRTSPVGGFAPGVYYRQSNTNGTGWSGAVQVTESLYFRTLAQEAAHVGVASDGAGETLVTWDDPQLGQSLYARLEPNGLAFGEPVLITAGAAAGDAPPQQTDLLALPGGNFMTLWRAGEGCSLYEQLYTPSLAIWSVPQRVLDVLSSCPAQVRNFPTSDGKQFVVIEQENGGVTMATWDNTGWSQPFNSQIRFIHPITQRATGLGCLKLAVLADRIAAIGCDDNGDVWVTTSQLVINELLPSLETVWSKPLVLAQPSANVGMPVLIVDTGGLMHAVWSESAPSGGQSVGLRYARGDGTLWSVGGLILRSPTGKADQPSLAVDGLGLLHAVWSGGDSGRIFYSQAFVRDAPAPTGWTTPLPLPAPRNVGAWPNIVSELGGRLHVVYAIPLNEDRGVYYVRSEDQGQSWNDPVKIFDATAAGWAMVGETHLVRDESGRLHVIWSQMTLPGSGSTLGVFHAYSDDEGVTWSAPSQVATGEARKARLVTAGQGQLHLAWVQLSLGKNEVWHRWSPDGGTTWSDAQRVLDTTSGLVEQINLTGDVAGHVFMTGIVRTADGAAELFSLGWDGQAWSNRERVALGYDVSDEAGALPVLLPSQVMGVLYRIRSPLAQGGGFYSIGYAERPVDIVPPQIVPTFTPVPPPTLTPAPEATFTPMPTPTQDLSDPVATQPEPQFWWRVWGVGAAMLLITVVAVARLWGGRRR